jgi:DNA-binding XRE family transcriptional regulator
MCSQEIEVYYVGSRQDTPYGSSCKGADLHKSNDVLVKEYGTAVRITPDSDDEKVDVFQTEWYKAIKRNLTPGKYLRVFRENTGITQAQLGKLLGGVPAQHISNMERGSRSISKKVAMQLSKIFDVSVEKFIG